MESNHFFYLQQGSNPNKPPTFVSYVKSKIEEYQSEYGYMGYEYNPSQKGNGDSPNLRKIQRSLFINGVNYGSGKHVIHITHPSDPKNKF